MNKKIYYYPCKEESQKLEFANTLYQMLANHWRPGQPIIVLCIGTDKVTGDSLGPFVGHQLNKMLHEKSLGTEDNLALRVIGTLNRPVHAMNLVETLKLLDEQMQERHQSLAHALTIVIDASLGFSHHLGYVTLSEQPLCPGEGVNKKLPKVGQISITGIIGTAKSSSYKSQLTLRQARLYDLMKLADFISDGLLQCLTRLNFRFPFVYSDGVCNSSNTLLLHNVNQDF